MQDCRVLLEFVEGATASGTPASARAFQVGGCAAKGREAVVLETKCFVLASGLGSLGGEGN